MTEFQFLADTPPLWPIQTPGMFHYSEGVQSYRYPNGDWIMMQCRPNPRDIHQRGGNGSVQIHMQYWKLIDPGKPNEFKEYRWAFVKNIGVEVIGENWGHNVTVWDTDRNVCENAPGLIIPPEYHPWSPPPLGDPGLAPEPGDFGFGWGNGPPISAIHVLRT